MLFLDHSPNTAMIMGAVLSGGDAMGLARRLYDAQNNSKDSLQPDCNRRDTDARCSSYLDAGRDNR